MATVSGDPTLNPPITGEVTGPPAAGPQGERGLQGLPGTDGTDGIDGTDGTDGIDGTNGLDGADGINGVDGAKGDKGDKGDSGTNGTNGADSIVPGPQGVPGVNGTGVLIGTGQPNSVVNGSPGDLYKDTAITAGAYLWQKASGVGTKTGWVCAVGDTGWRNISTLLTNGWTGPAAATGPALRRIGNQVLVRVRGLDPTASTSSVWATIPAGFIPPSAEGGMVMFTSTPCLVYCNTAATAIVSPPPTQVGSSCATQWTTNQAWPTVLPGVVG